MNHTDKCIELLSGSSVEIIEQTNADVLYKNTPMLAWFMTYVSKEGTVWTRNVTGEPMKEYPTFADAFQAQIAYLNSAEAGANQ